MSQRVRGEVLVGDDGGQAIVIRIRDVAGIVSKQSGTAGFVTPYIPQTMSNIVYSKIRDEILSSLKQKGIVADVTIVATAPSGSAPKNDLVTGLVAGGGVVGAGWLLSKLLRKKR